MNASELNLKNQSFTFSCNIHNAKSHYKFLMNIGRVFPTTKPQAKHFISNGICLDVLNSRDVVIIEELLNKHGFIGEYKYTKSKTWVRLQNNTDLHKALKLEYYK